VAHVELSLTEASTVAHRRSVTSASAPGWGTVDRWSSAVDAANEPCMVIDGFATIVAISGPAASLLGFPSAGEAIGQSLYDHAFPLLDFTAEGAELSHDEIQRTPPVLALTSGLLARGVLRVRTGGEIFTMDAVSTPLLDGSALVGSLTFFCVV